MGSCGRGEQIHLQLVKCKWRGHSDIFLCPTIYRVLLFSVCWSGGSFYSSADALLGINIDTYHTFSQGEEVLVLLLIRMFSFLNTFNIGILTFDDGIDNTWITSSPPEEESVRGQEGRKEGERKEVIVVANAALHIIINLIYGRRGSSLNTIHILSDLVFNLFHPPPVIICVPFIPGWLPPLLQGTLLFFLATTSEYGDT